MGADWYSAITIYGYEIRIPVGSKYGKVLNALKNCMPTHDSIRVYGCLSEVHSRLEGASWRDLASLEQERGFIVIGFEPTYASSFIEETKELRRFIEQHEELFSKYTSSHPRFHSGINWDTHYYSDNEDEE